MRKTDCTNNKFEFDRNTFPFTFFEKKEKKREIQNMSDEFIHASTRKNCPHLYFILSFDRERTAVMNQIAIKEKLRSFVCRLSF